MQLQQLLQERKVAMDKADAILTACQMARREMTAMESAIVGDCTKQLEILGPQIEELQAKNTLARQVQKHGPAALFSNPSGEGRPFSKPQPVTFSEEYAQGFYHWIASGG